MDLHSKSLISVFSEAPPLLVCCTLCSFRLSCYEESYSKPTVIGIVFLVFFFFKKKAGVFKRLPLYEGTAYILLKKRTYTD